MATNTLVKHFATVVYFNNIFEYNMLNLCKMLSLSCNKNSSIYIILLYFLVIFYENYSSSEIYIEKKSVYLCLRYD